jgi:hypothetical protein
MILDGVLRVETVLHEVRSLMVSLPLGPFTFFYVVYSHSA